MGILWTIIIGFIAGVIAKFIMPGSNEPSGFILTTILGVVGAVIASYLGQALGWYGPSGTFMSCEHQMQSARQGAGTCTLSDRSKYQVHIGG